MKDVHVLVATNWYGKYITDIVLLSRAQLEEIAAAVTDDFDRFFFGVSPEEEREDILPTPIDQLAKGKATGPRMR